MYNDFDVFLTKVLKDMEEQRNKLSHPFVGSEHLLLSLLRLDKTSILLFSDYGVTYDTFYTKLVEVVGTCKKNVEFNLYTPLLKRVINYAIEEAKISKEKVNSKYILESLLEENEGVAIRILLSMDVDLDDVYKKLNENKTEEFKSVSFGKNLNQSVCNEEKVVGRDKEISFIIETLLRKKKNNPLLIGDAGVGKTAIVEELARNINKGNVPMKLKNSNIISLDISSIVAGTKYRGEFEEKLNNIIESSIKNPKIILFIDEIHTISNAGGAEGAIGAGDILKPYLARGDIKVIGATTTREYEKYIEKDKALARRFETVFVKEPNLDETITILKNIKSEYEEYHSVFISNKNLIDIAKLSNKFIFNKKNPDKSIDFLDSISSYVQIKNDNSNIMNKWLNDLKKVKELKEKSVLDNEFDDALKYHDQELLLEDKLQNINVNNKAKITMKDIYKVLETKTNVPSLLSLKNIKELCSSILSDITQKDIITNLLVDKVNDISKVKSLFIKGDDTLIIDKVKQILKGINYIKINGKDYEKEDSVMKLTGVPSGYAGSTDNYIFSKLKTNPFALVHIENYDKCSFQLKNIIKDIIKNGYILDSKCEELNFRNALIVASSSEKTVNKVGFNNDLKANNSSNELFDYYIDNILVKEKIEN